LKKDKRSRGNRVQFCMCAVTTCSCVATQKHHYIPWRFIPENSFTLQLCEDHHKMIDEMLSKIETSTPLNFFRIMFEFIYGRGAAYRRLAVGEDTLNIPRETTHYCGGGNYADETTGVSVS
jgi:hypothetical protein